MKPRLHLNGRKGPKPYVYQHAADWDRDSWNGISYDGIGRSRRPEANVLIRMRFKGHAERVWKRANLAHSKRWVLRASLRHYRGMKRRRKLIEFRKVLA